MHDAGAATWREVVDKHHCALVDELSTRIDSELQGAILRAIELENTKLNARLERSNTDARRSQAESLNQIIRRLRRAASSEQVLETLGRSCAEYAEKLVVLVFENNHARSICTYGPGPEELSFDTDAAPAIVSAIDSRDPVTALAAESEISVPLAEALGLQNQLNPDERVYLFPVIGRHSVLALLAATGVKLPAPIELLCEASGMRIDAIPAVSASPDASSPAEPPALVQLAPGVPASETSASRSWDELSAEDQKLHLQAQRMARVRVAEMRLYHENELASGAASKNIYQALQKEIDAARDQFLHTFLAKSPTMVDYLHLEILRSLASDDDRLLGDGYPGPMV
jgi:hypothetical protein